MTDRPYRGLSERQLDDRAQSLLDQMNQIEKDLDAMWRDKIVDEGTWLTNKEYQSKEDLKSTLSDERKKISDERGIRQAERAQRSI